MSANLDRGLVLFGRLRFDLAEGFFQKAALEEPEDWRAHAFLAYCLGARKRSEAALREGGEAVRLAPEKGWAFHALAKARYSAGMLAQAEEAINEALRLEPQNELHFSLKSAILFDQKRWTEALASAESGLRIDPEDKSCANLRALALMQLDHPHEALKTSRSVLSRDPENAMAHAIAGRAWTELDDPLRAREHLRESLRINPSSDYAREGLIRTRGGRWTVSLPSIRSYKKALGIRAAAVIVLIIMGQIPRLLVALDEHSGSLAALAARLVPQSVLATILLLVLVLVWVPKLVVKFPVWHYRIKDPSS